MGFYCPTPFFDDIIFELNRKLVLLCLTKRFFFAFRNSICLIFMAFEFKLFYKALEIFLHVVQYSWCKFHTTHKHRQQFPKFVIIHELLDGIAASIHTSHVCSIPGYHSKRAIAVVVMIRPLLAAAITLVFLIEIW